MLLNHLLARLRVILLERNPQTEQATVLIRQYVAECNIDQESWMQDASVHDLGLPSATANLFFNEGYETVRSLVAATEAELLRVEQSGPRIVNQVKEALAKQRLYLANDRPLLDFIDFDDFDEEF